MQEVEGETLGEKHKNFNVLVQNAFKENPNRELEDIDYHQPDITNLFKIDFACRTRNVDCILKVFKCQDLLYVSRAIKHSTWLISDTKYAHIINPHYIHNDLLPFMLTEGGNKLMLYVRLNLKDPKRYEDFFDCLKSTDIEVALKFLPYCSSEFVASKLTDLIYLIPDHMLLRLFPCNLEVFRIYCNSKRIQAPLIYKALFLIGKYGEDFFDILDTVKSEYLPHFKTKYTKLAMKTCPHRIMFNFHNYSKHIDLLCFVKYIDTDRFNEFITKYGNDEDVCSLFDEKQQQRILEPNVDTLLLSKLINCDTDDYILCSKILQDFKDNLPVLMKNLKFTFHLINIVDRSFKIHRFNTELWSIYNDIYKEINIKKYSKRNKTLQSYIRNFIAYQIIHSANISEEMLSDFEFYTFKSDLTKFNEDEKKVLFAFLMNFALNKIENLPFNSENEILLWIERVVILLDDWDKNLNDHYLITTKISYIIAHIKTTSNIEGLQKLYDRRKFWRKALFHEYINIDSKTCVNILKHDPNILHLYKDKVLACSTGVKTFRNFYFKIRTYWPNTLALHFKTLYVEQLKTIPSIIGLHFLLTKSEFSDFINSYAPDNDFISKGSVEEIILCKNIAKNMHHCRPKPSLQTAMLYARDVCMIDVIASLNSLLNSLPVHEFDQNFNMIHEKPLLQKLCVWVAFSKKSRKDEKQLVFQIWHKTNYTSVKSEIIRMYINFLTKHTKKEWNIRYKYLDVIREQWRSLEILMEDVTDEVIIRELSRKVRKLPLSIRTEFILKWYDLIKHLQPKCETFPRTPMMCYTFAMHDLDKSLLAEIIEDCITNRLWRTKLNYHYIDLLVSCLFTSKNEDEQIACFNKIIAPVFHSAYKMWNEKTCGLLLVQYNINNIVTGLCKRLFNCSDNNSKKPPTVIILLLNSLQDNVPVDENYIMITKLKLAVEYFNVLSEYEESPEDEIHKRAVQGFSKICIKIFSENIATFGKSIWKLFYHVLQMMLDDFSMIKSTQYKLYNYMLDLCTTLSSELDVLVHVLVMELSLYVDDFFTLFFDDSDDYVDHEGQIALLERIKQHPSLEVKANYSKVILSIYEKVSYTQLSYRDKY
ncbi:uncharacterized protein LOC119837483 [Zerene cesonia]|uniref:uncharacterized protein LOC119837483 n=1 Tax=Zerene cesonia TaxID=33412 RepID=UPI0018E53F38|nr:uncharacterized protein LOC119837483 [Zerene cesonia]